MPIPAIITTRISEHRALKEDSRKRGVFQIALGGYIGYEAVTNGMRRALGIRIEEHTTNRKNARNIIRNGCVLDPAYGGKTIALNSDGRSLQSNKNFVHITGLNDKTMESFIGELKNTANKKPVKHFSNPIKVLLKNVASNMYRKLQKYAYRFYSQPEALEVQNKMRKQDSNASFGTVVSNCINILTGHKSKTFYVPGNEEFFNKNFMADIDDFALKTNKPLKVCKTKLGAMFKGLKEFGLTGIPQNKTRAITGIAIFASLSTVSLNLIKSGIKNIKNSDQNN